MARAGIALLFLAAGLGYGAWAASVAGVKLSLGLSDGALGLALLSVAAGAMLAMPVAGWLGARGIPWLLTGSGVVFVVALPLPMMAGGWLGLVATLLVLGAAAGSIDVLMNARASRFEQGFGRAVMSSFHAAFSLGGLLGTGVVAAAEWAGWGWQTGLLGSALALAGAVVAHAALDRSPVIADADAEAGPRFALPGRAVVGIGALCLLAFMTEGAVADWSGVFLRDHAGASPAGTTAGFAAFSASMVVARLFGDSWVRRFGRGRVMGVGAAAAAAGIAGATAVPVLAPVGFGLVGLGAANLAPVLFSAAGRDGSTGIAAAATMGYAGMLFGPPLIGGIAELTGLRLALLVLVAAMVVISIAAGRIVAKR